MTGNTGSTGATGATGVGPGVRTILHVDMDAFYVSVELRRRPELHGQPVVVGGTGPRGVVAAASYEARRYGVFSAMPSAVARRRCPHAVFLPGDHDLYSRVSAEVHEVFGQFTPLVEGLALDEAFLDLTGGRRLFGSGASAGHAIRAAIAERLELSCSVGVASNKFLAKLASKAAKPVASTAGVRPGLGVVEVEPGSELAFLHPLSVKALWGVGPATFERLQRLGVETVGDLARLGEAAIVGALGAASGRHLYRLANGLDDRPIEPDRGMKSIGHEETYPYDLYDRADLHTQVVRLSDAVASRLRHQGVGARTITLKVRFAGFKTITRSYTTTAPLTTGPAIAAAVLPLLDAIDPTAGVRLLGVSGSNLGEAVEQLSLDTLFGDTSVGDTSFGTTSFGDTSFGDTSFGDGAASTGGPAPPVTLEHSWHDASAAVDDIRARFGAAAIGPAAAMQRGAVRPVRTGAQAWGPDSHDSPPDDQRSRSDESE
jgi:DNA polymerase-4